MKILKISEDTYFPPLSLEVMTEAIDLIKDRSLKTELSRHGQSSSGSVPECRKRLKKAVKASYQRLASSLLLPRTQTQYNALDSDFVTNAIETLEKSIVDLQAKISAQNAVLQTLALCNDSSKSKSPVPPDLTKELNTFDRRLEKIEELISSIKEEQTESANNFAKLETNVSKIQSDTTETKERVKSASVGPPNNGRDGRKSSAPNNKRPDQGRRRNNSNPPPPPHAKPKKKILLLHDSQLNKFQPESFSKAFAVEKFKAGSYTDLLNKHLREVVGKPAVDSYVLQLGVNDYRYQTTEPSLKKAIEDCKSCITKLLSSSSAKLVVVLPTPTPGGPISDRTIEFVRSVTEFITQKRQSDGTWKRLFTVNNLGSFDRALQKLDSPEDSPNPLQADKLHVSDYGLKKLCLNMKYGIYRAFNMKPPRKQTSAEPES